MKRRVIDLTPGEMIRVYYDNKRTGAIVQKITIDENHVALDLFTRARVPLPDVPGWRSQYWTINAGHGDMVELYN